MRTLPPGTLILIDRLNDDTLNVSITAEGLGLDPVMWGSLLGDLFRNLVKGYVMSYDMDEHELVRDIMGEFMKELQTPDKKEKSIPVLPMQSEEDN